MQHHCYMHRNVIASKIQSTMLVVNIVTIVGNSSTTTTGNLFCGHLEAAPKSRTCVLRVGYAK
jgi:hypothetical protein